MALLFQRIRCRTLVFPHVLNPLLPWAWFPFKVLPSFQLSIWTAPELIRHSGVALDRAHQSEWILDVTSIFMLV
jgi:hypothetical protein